jgi:hypothetical protein
MKSRKNLFELEIKYSFQNPFKLKQILILKNHLLNIPFLFSIIAWEAKGKSSHCPIIYWTKPYLPIQTILTLNLTAY